MASTSGAPARGAAPRADRFWLRAAAWAAVLALGFAIVFAFGRPLPSEAETLDAAMHPAPPVSQEAAERSAETIVRLQYPDLVDAERSTARRDDFGVARWVVTYSAGGDTLSGVRVSVVIDTGNVEVAAFP